MRIIATVFCIAIGLPWTAAAAQCEQDQDYLRAQTLRAQGKYTEAQTLLEQIIAADHSCMAARMDLALVLFSLENYTASRELLRALRPLVLQGGLSAQAQATLLATIDSHLNYIELLLTETVLPLQAVRTEIDGAAEPSVQVALAAGGTDNINGGLRQDTLTFNWEQTTITQPLAKRSKAQSGHFFDVEAAYRAEPQTYAGMQGTLRVMTAMRHNPEANEYDLGVVRGGLELQALPGQAHPWNPTAVLSAGVFSLDGSPYRQDATVGLHVTPTIQERKVRFSYQLTDSQYLSTPENDARFHKANLTIPLWEGGNTHINSVSVGLDISQQWPETRDRLADYRENSLRLRGKAITHGHTITASYAQSTQHDAHAYNPLAFHERKRNLRQRFLDIGWSYPASAHMTYEANLQLRQTDSAIPLFATDAAEFTAGVRWSLD